MMREPDWESLNDLNFLVYTRLANTLNAALSALELADTPGLDDQTPRWWRNRAHAKLSGTLSTLMAWSWLIQHKNGMQLPQQAIRSFELQTTVDWLSEKLQLGNRGQASSTLILTGNPETFQEAILLLHSVSMSQGSSVKVAWEQKSDQVEFSCSFKRRRKREPYANVDDLLASFNTHWRAQLTSFELQIAKHLLELNHSKLEFIDDGKLGEFRFSLPGTTKVIPTSIPINRSNGRISSQDLPSDLKKQIKQVKNQISTQISHSEIVGNLSPDNKTLVLSDGELQDDNATIPLPGMANVTPNSEVTPPTLEANSLGASQTTPTGAWQEEKTDSNTAQHEKKLRPTTTTGEWQSVLDYEDIDWTTLGFLNEHTYHRLTNPLIKAMGHLETVRLVRDDEKTFTKTLDFAYDHLERMVTSMKAWATLTDWRNHQIEPLRKIFTPIDFPDWFKRQLEPQTKFDCQHTLNIKIHQDALLESILLLSEITQQIGTLEEITIRDRKKKQGIWLRIIFSPPPERRYSSKLDVLDSFIRSNPAGDELAVRYAVANDLFNLNGTEFTLQENQKTGKQAFAIMFPVQSEEKETVENPVTEASTQTKKLSASSELKTEKTTT